VQKTAARIATGLATAAVLVVGGLLAIAFVPTLFGAESLIVTSGSMGKSMPVGSVAVTRLVDARAVSAGDVISFMSPGSRIPTTHRVVAVTDDGVDRVFRTKGDANPAQDPEPVRVNGRVHVVERVVPFAGRVAVFARSPEGLVALLLIPAAGLLYERRRAARASALAHEEPPAPADPPAAGPSPIAAAVFGAVCGGVAAGLLIRRAERHARGRPRTAG
jgi:signal peptidase